MRRISLALALFGAIAAAGCSGGSNPSSSGTSKGTPGSTFTLEVRGETVAALAGGVITSSPAGINCGDGAAACKADFPWGTAVTLTATPSGANNYYAFAGSCQGVGSVGGAVGPFTCSLKAQNADQMVVVRFSSKFLGGHPNWSNGTLHETQAYALNCSQCHGNMNQGAGIAPACNTCHNGGYVERTGLVAAIDSVSVTTPVTVQFTLKDEQGKFIDVTGLSTTNTAWSRRSQPVPLTISLNYFGTDAAGNVLGYRLPANTGGNPATVTVRSNTGQTTSGTKAAGFVQIAADGTRSDCGAATCTCSAANPCYAVVTTGTQGGNACTAAAPCTCSSANPCGAALAAADGYGLLTLNRATGQYTYTFPNTANYANFPTDLANATVWLQATRQEDRANAFNAKRFTPVNVEYNFATPGATGTVVGARHITDNASCAKCHNGFKAEANATGTGWAGFHGAARISGPYCAICHYDGRGSGQWVGVDIAAAQTGGGADSAVFVHRLHAAEEMLTKVTTGTQTVGMQFLADGTKATCSATAVCTCTATTPCIPNAFHGMTVTYPQTPANCRECHPNTQQGNQYRTNPSRAACGSCHDAVNFATGVGHNPTGLHGIAANLVQANDTACAGCHLPAYIDSAHNIALPPDTGSVFHVAGGNTRTNAGYIAPAGKLPSGAIQLSAVVREVRRAVVNGVGRPQIDFKLQGQTATVPAWDVVFNGSVTDGVSVQPELVTSFVGSIGVYFAWALPQDGIAAPSDFNTTSGASLKLVWNGKGTGTGAGTLSGPDAQGFYTATLTGVQVPTTATMLTGGIGYQYDLPNNQPFTQTDLAAYPVSAATNPAYAATGLIGGLIVPIQNQWKVATSYAARRTVVENARCNACHAQLGVGPTFHVGQRNDAPTCAFCHNPNRSNATGGWSVNSAAAIHGIHGAKARVNNFTWEGAGYYNVEYPGSSCEQCHVPGSYNFGTKANLDQFPNMLFSSVSGTQTELTHWVTVGQALGAGPACSNSTGACTTGAATNLVHSPIAGACFACHDSDATKTHMEAMGGKIYAPRGASTPANAEACLSCHGAGKVLDVAKVH